MTSKEPLDNALRDGNLHVEIDGTPHVFDGSHPNESGVSHVECGSVWATWLSNGKAWSITNTGRAPVTLTFRSGTNQFRSTLTIGESIWCVTNYGSSVDGITLKDRPSYPSASSHAEQSCGSTMPA
jgi:hypothetical protein